MKSKHLDSLSQGDILVVNRESTKIRNYNIGHEFKFRSFTRNSPHSSSMLILFDKNGVHSFSPNVCRFLETKQVMREKKLKEIFGE